MKNFTLPVVKSIQLVVLLFLATSSLQAQVSGVVFRDYNGNGTKDANETFVQGVTVKAFNASDAQISTTKTTSAAGAYSFTAVEIPGGSPARLEFTLPASGSCVNTSVDFSATSGLGNGTSVQFVTGGATNINYGINNPADYNTGTTGVMMHVPVQLKGDPLAAGSAVGALNWFVGFPYTSSGSGAPTLTLNGTTIGACWGQAYSKQAQKIFTAAFIKRHSGLGVMGSGGIYLLTPTATTYNVTQFFDMDNNTFNTAGTPTTRTRADATAPAYGAGSSFNINLDPGNGNGVTTTYLGAVDALTGLPSGLGVVGTNAQRGLGTTANSVDYDPAAFDQVGKVGMGDIDISDDGKYLFVTNLYSRKIFRLTLNDANNPTSVTAVAEYSLPAIAVTNGVLRPFALKFYRDKLYVGAIASGENGGVNNVGGTTDMYAYVLQLDNPTATASFVVTPVISYPLNYLKGMSAGGLGTKWEP